MYLDPLVLYREYVQNAVDSIDLAIKQGILSQREAQVVIRVVADKCLIIIEDNGMGISAEQAQATLLDIGNSKKSYKSARGFRGIGRLVGLSYAQRLVFETSYQGEECGSRITFHSDRLQELLTPGEYTNFNLEDVLIESVRRDTYPEDVSAHYFRVILENVADRDEALQAEKVREYIAQSCPLPYDEEIFSWGDLIKHGLAEHGQQLAEYRIALQTIDDEQLLYKPYRDCFLADRQKKLMDSLENIELYPLISPRQELLGMVWLGKSKMLGSVLNDNIKGIRFRKGNILVGDKASLNGIFKEDRFNGWFQGEIFVFHENIIPNARRDSFERTPEFAELMDALETLGDELSCKIRAASVARAKIPRRRVFTNEEEREQGEIMLVDNSVSIAHALKTLNILRQSKVSTLPFLDADQKLTFTEKKLLEKLYEFLRRELNDTDAMHLLVKFVEQQEQKIIHD
jgi:molecular chaperone HtpG